MSEQTGGQQAERLIKLLYAQKGLYQQLRRLSDLQAATICADEADRLLALLAARQKVINQLTRINRELVPYRQEWDAIYARMPSRHQAEAQRVLQEVRGLLTEILARDESDQKKLSARHASLGRQLDLASAGKRAHSSYYHQPAASAVNLVDARS